jgi:hypothetical protein
VYHGWLYFGDEDLKGDESLGCGTAPKLWPRSPITKIQGLVGTPLSTPPCLPATGVPRGSTTEPQGMEWMSTGAKVSNWDCMLYNLNPLNQRPGHTHIAALGTNVSFNDFMRANKSDVANSQKCSFLLARNATC